MNVAQELKANVIAKDCAKYIYDYFVNPKDVSGSSLFSNVCLRKVRVLRATGKRLYILNIYLLNEWIEERIMNEWTDDLSWINERMISLSLQVSLSWTNYWSLSLSFSLSLSLSHTLTLYHSFSLSLSPSLFLYLHRACVTIIV